MTPAEDITLSQVAREVRLRATMLGRRRRELSGAGPRAFQARANRATRTWRR